MKILYLFTFLLFLGFLRLQVLSQDINNQVDGEKEDGRVVDDVRYMVNQERDVEMNINKLTVHEPDVHSSKSPEEAHVIIIEQGKDGESLNKGRLKEHVQTTHNKISNLNNPESLKRSVNIRKTQRQLGIETSKLPGNEDELVDISSQHEDKRPQMSSERRGNEDRNVKNNVESNPTLLLNERKLSATEAPTNSTNSPTETPSISPTFVPTTQAPTEPTNSPTQTPSISPTVVPTTQAPTDATDSPTETPTDATDSPTEAPTDATDSPTESPTDATDSPTESPTDATDSPTESPTDATDSPTESPTDATDSPTESPTDATDSPTESPTDATDSPTESPTDATDSPTESPTDATGSPTESPTDATQSPTQSPADATDSPTESPTDATDSPTTDTPSISPTSVPTTQAPTGATISPTDSPTDSTGSPTESPTDSSESPTESPTDATDSPTESPTDSSESPTRTPTDATQSPTESPTEATDSPTDTPSASPTFVPTTSAPTDATHSPTQSPSNSPTLPDCECTERQYVLSDGSPWLSFVLRAPEVGEDLCQGIDPSTNKPVCGRFKAVANGTPPCPTESSSFLVRELADGETRSVEIDGVCVFRTFAPSLAPTISPTQSPTAATRSPTLSPTTDQPTLFPTELPTTNQPTESPTQTPTDSPTFEFPDCECTQRQYVLSDGSPWLSYVLRAPEIGEDLCQGIDPSTNKPVCGRYKTVANGTPPCPTNSLSFHVREVRDGETRTVVSSGVCVFRTTAPTHSPTSSSPTGAPTVPSQSPTLTPTQAPTDETSSPTASPLPQPTNQPTLNPTTSPTNTPTVPTVSPTSAPTTSPTVIPSFAPSETPSAAPSTSPTVTPSFAPSETPSVSPSTSPTETPTNAPTEPTNSPTVTPTSSPTVPTLSPTQSPTLAPTPRPKPNVLIIMVDDLNTQAVGVYDKHDLAITPHMDRIINKGLRFNNMHCVQAECAPSRLTFVTGATPDTLRIRGFENKFRDRNPGLLTYPGLFRRNGYATVAVGKVTDFRSWASSSAVEFDHPDECHKPDDMRALCSWDYYSAREIHRNETVCGTQIGHYPGVAPDKIPRDGSVRPSIQGPLIFPGGKDEDFIDYCTASHALNWIDQLTASEKPWLLAVGFTKPHLPWVAPTRHFQMHSRLLDTDNADKLIPPNDNPQFFWDKQCAGEHTNPPDFELKSYPDYANQNRRQRLQGYYASVSFMDEQIGRVH